MHIGVHWRKLVKISGGGAPGARIIGGGRDEWLGGHHGECGAQAYNGGLGQSPQRDPGAEPLVGGQGAKSP